MVENGPMLQLWVALGVSLLYFIVLIVISHITHALTLLVSAYQVLCSVVALVGCMLTIKHTGRGLTQPIEEDKDQKQEGILPNEELKKLSNGPTCLPRYSQSSKERRAVSRLENTFGWVRIDLLFLLVGCVFLASFCFSVLVEALQTLVHISHHDEMHHPLPVVALGCLGLLINTFIYFLVGGFMYQEGTILRLTKSGEVVLETIAEKAEAQKDDQNVSFVKNNFWLRLLRDNLGSFFVIICGAVVYFAEDNVAKYVDPIFSFVSSVSLLALNFPYMKESCLILLQTIPNHIDIVSLKGRLLSSYPQIINVHDFHIWQLNEDKTILTAHLAFMRPQEYQMVHAEITTFFLKNGITHTTIQPEFFNELSNINPTLESPIDKCLVRCSTKDCLEAVCCSFEDSLESVTITEREEKQLGTPIRNSLHQNVTNEMCNIDNSVRKEENLDGPEKEDSLVKNQNQSTKTEIIAE